MWADMVGGPWPSADQTTERRNSLKVYVSWKKKINLKNISKLEKISSLCCKAFDIHVFLNRFHVQLFLGRTNAKWTNKTSVLSCSYTRFECTKCFCPSQFLFLPVLSELLGIKKWWKMVQTGKEFEEQSIMSSREAHFWQQIQERKCVGQIV